MKKETNNKEVKENWLPDGLVNMVGSIAMLGITTTICLQALNKLTKQLEKEEISRLKKLRRKGKCLVGFRNISKGNYYDFIVYKNEEVKMNLIQ